MRTTLLAAHAVPPEYKDRADDYINYVCDEVLPAAVAEGLADAVDAYCDTVGFTAAQVERVFVKAKELGHSVAADCRRALKQYREVERLWEELREASPSGPLMAEGRIVAAGALADQGDLAAAIRLLSKGFRLPKHPGEHHLRRAYALADLYERAGDLPQARSIFERIQRAEPDFLDTTARIDALR